VPLTRVGRRSRRRIAQTTAAGADPQGITATADRAAHLPAEPTMSLVPCTCIRSVDLRSVVLPDPACPAGDVHSVTGAVGG
jgi:hypothetical protein